MIHTQLLSYLMALDPFNYCHRSWCACSYCKWDFSWLRWPCMIPVSICNKARLDKQVWCKFFTIDVPGISDLQYGDQCHHLCFRREHHHLMDLTWVTLHYLWLRCLSCIKNTIQTGMVLKSNHLAWQISQVLLKGLQLENVASLGAFR